jgi:hypothetical protein
MGQRKTVLQASRTAAKVGMGTSMAALVYTAMKRGRSAMHLHTWAGIGLLGFTLWHIYLYQPKRKAAAARHRLAAQRPPADK